MSGSRHRVALLAPGCDRVLAVAAPDGPRLPTALLDWPSPEEITAVVDAPGAWIAAPGLLADDGSVTHVLVGDERSSLEGHDWVPVAGFGRLDEVAASLAAGAAPLGSADWYRPGWRDDVVAWLDRVGLERGFERVGDPVQVKVWGLGAVLRQPVRSALGERDLWFKATCEGFRAEPALTAAVASLAPERSPVVVAVDAGRAWMVLESIPNADDADPARAAEAARAWARLQLESLDHGGVLRAAGLPDRGLAPTLQGLDEVVHRSVQLPMMSDAQRDRAREIQPWLEASCRELWSLGLPDTLSHGDLHLYNVAWPSADAESPVFFDWTDASSTHPLLDGARLAESARRNSGEELADEVWEAFAVVWRAAYPDVDHARGRALAPVVNGVFQAVSYEQILRAQPEVSRWELGGVVVELLDQLAELAPRAR